MEGYSLRPLWDSVKYYVLAQNQKHVTEDVVAVSLILSTLFIMFFIYKIVVYINPLSKVKRLGLDVINKAFGITSKIEQALGQIRKDVHKAKEVDVGPIYSSIPKLSDNEIVQRLEKIKVIDSKKGLGGKQGATYFCNPNEDTQEFISNQCKNFLYCNPLFMESCPGAQLIENELIQFMLELNNAPKGAVGTTTTGGTESLLLAMLTYREYGYKKGITEPEVLMPNSAHAAFIKAAQLFKIKIRQIPIDENTGTVTLKQYMRGLTKNTVAVVCTGGTWAHGIIDPVQEVSKALEGTDIWIHVDCCLGGYMTTASGLKGDGRIPVIDFRNLRVGTISVDPHKYGEAPKGCSVLLFRTEALKKHSLFYYMKWNGGIYATPSLPGSRSSAAYIGAWISLVRLGKAGLIKYYEEVSETIDQVVKIINGFPELKVIGNPKCCVVSFTTRKESRLSIFDVQEAIKADGWNLPMMQKPYAAHITVTKHNMKNLRTQFKEALQKAIAYAKSKPDCGKKSFDHEIYCSLMKVPDNDMIEDVIKTLLVEVNKLKPDN